MVEQAGAVSVEGQVSIEDLIKRTKRTLRDLRSALTKTEKKSDKNKPSLERLLSNFDFIEELVQLPVVSEYLNRRQRRIRITGSGFNDLLYIDSSGVYREVEMPKYPDCSEVTRDDLLRMWDVGAPKPITQLSNMSKEGILKRIEKGIK